MQASTGRSGGQQTGDREADRKRGQGLPPEQVQLALTQAWTGFNTQIGREYSSLTLTLPKNRMVKLSCPLQMLCLNMSAPAIKQSSIIGRLNLKILSFMKIKAE